MKLYHGSDTAIDLIDLYMSKPYKDFGKGFYLSADFSQAFNMAKQRIRQKHVNNSPVVTEKLKIIWSSKPNK